MKMIKRQFINQFCLMAICSMIVYSCSQSFSKIHSVEFVPINYSVILEDDNSMISKFNIAVTYNKYYNEAVLPKEFVDKYRTDTISYKKQMAIECFLGHQNKFKNISIDKIMENKSNIKIYFDATINEDTSSYFQPFLIGKVHKTRKNVIFYLNGAALNKGLQSIYVK